MICFEQIQAIAINGSEEMKFEEENPALKIKVSKEMIESLFSKRDKPVICTKGLEGDYECVGVIQSDRDATFSFLFVSKNNRVEGSVFKEFTPEYQHAPDVVPEAQ